MSALFDVIRKIAGGRLTQSQVDAVNAALEGRAVPTAPSKPEEHGNPSIVGRAGIALIKQFEGCHKPIGAGRFMAYPDPGTGGAPFTIGWGSTKGPDGKSIAPGTVWTQAQCDEQLERDLVKYAADVAKAIGNAPTSQAQFDAMVSFHYNTGAIHRATLTRKHKAGDYAGAAAEFGKWNKAAGRVLKGLTRRRAEEAKLYRSGS